MSFITAWAFPPPGSLLNRGSAPATPARQTALGAPLAQLSFAPPQKPLVEHVVPFKVGETLTYDVSWSDYISAGTAVATVKEKKASFNSTAYYIVAEGRPSALLSAIYSFYYKVDTLLDSYTPLALHSVRSLD
jgi:hypothetical protein